MVSFVQKVANFYVRDPRVQQRQPSSFYNDYYGRTTNYGNVPYNPNAYGAYNNPVGLTGAGINYSGYNNNNYLPGVLGSAGAGPIVPGLSTSTGYGDTASLFTQNNPIKNIASALGLADPSTTRLNNNNLPLGADYSNLPYNSNDPKPISSMNGDEDVRVMVSDPTGKLIGSSPITAPLSSTNGVIFPYTPTVTFGHKANYDMENLLHTNYAHPVYKHSDVDAIGIQAKFTAQNYKEAQYILAVIQFFRSATKMFYGSDSIAGTPPPVLRLDGYGKLLMDHLPVVCTSFDFSLPEDVDYISTQAGPSKPGAASDAGNGVGTNFSDTGYLSMVPTQLQINLNFKLVYSRNRLSNDFGMEKFVAGDLLTNSKRGNGPGKGGFI